MKIPTEKDKDYVAVPAPIGRRALAFLIDLVILNVVVFYPFQKYLRSMVPSLDFKEAYHFLVYNQEATSTMFLISLAMAFLAFLYFSMLELRYQQSIGKMMLQLKIVSEHHDVKAWQIGVRNLFVIPFFPFIVLWILDPVWIMINKENKRFSEIISRTNVIQYVAFQKQNFI